MSFAVDYTSIDAAAITNKYFDLNNVPVSTTNVALDLIGGTAQSDTDFAVIDSTRVSWNGYALDGMLTAGDKIRVIYDASSI